MKFDGFFKEFLSVKTQKWKIVLAALCGVALIIIGTLPQKEVSAPELEERVAEMCAMTEGVGDVKVMITHSDDGAVYAVAVICDGADSVAVRERITDMMCSLFGIGANRVSILKISE